MPRSSGLKRIGPGALEAELYPFADRAMPRRALERAVAVRGHLHLVAPAHAGEPALAGELVGGGSERIGHAVEDVGLAVAVAVGGVWRNTRSA